jgi:hypothetical protein
LLDAAKGDADNAWQSLGDKRRLVSTAACLKQFFASLGIAGSQTRYYVDELAILDGRLRDSRLNLKQAAASKVEDLTAEGLKQLAIRTGAFRASTRS